MYSFEIFEKSPSKNPFGLVVVKPTLMFSDIVDLHIPSKSYLIIELALRLTPISINDVFVLKISKTYTVLSHNNEVLQNVIIKKDLKI